MTIFKKKSMKFFGYKYNKELNVYNENEIKKELENIKKKMEKIKLEKDIDNI